MGVKTWNIQKGPHEVFCNFSGAQGKGLYRFKYWLFRLGSPREQLLDCTECTQRRGSLSGPVVNVCSAACGIEVFHNRGCFSSCWRRVSTKQLERTGQVRAKGDWKMFNSPQAPGPCVLWHETLQEECDIKGNKGICDQTILVCRILIGLSTQRSSNPSN